MIKTKHFMDPVATDDGPRIWVEPIGLCGDLRTWCAVDLVLPDVGPPPMLWEWFQEHQNEGGYVMFRRAYQSYLRAGPLRPALERLAAAGISSCLTLLHQGEHRTCNTATALRDLLEEMTPCPPSEWRPRPA
jgi:uncharacterized protein YeaO (DUF488 family)